jgi:hypothetical protein
VAQHLDGLRLAHLVVEKDHEPLIASKAPEEAVITLGHILNNFDRPYDLSIDEGYSAEGGTPGTTSSEVTLFTWMNDKVRNLYFLRTIDALNFT